MIDAVFSDSSLASPALCGREQFDTRFIDSLTRMAIARKLPQLYRQFHADPDAQTVLVRDGGDEPSPHWLRVVDWPAPDVVVVRFRRGDASVDQSLAAEALTDLVIAPPGFDPES